MAENSLVIFTKAAQMLAQADTIQKTKELKNLALTAADWAKRKGMGKDAIQHCQSYALEAERKMGGMLAVTDRAINRPGPGRGKAGDAALPALPDTPPTLAALGLTKRESADAQWLSELPDETFEKVKQGTLSVAKAKKEIKAKRDKRDLADAQKTISVAKRKSIESVCDLRVCSCADLFKSGIKPDAVITDPPYPQKFLPVFTELAEGCKAAGVPLVAVMSGQSYLPEVMRRLCEHLRYRWTLAYMTPGGSCRIWPVKIDCQWKPVFLFGEASEVVFDVFRSDASEKRFHEWGQSLSGMADLVDRLTKPSQLVCDPFLGAGSAAVVSLKLGRRFVGCDVDADCVQQAREWVMA